MSFLTGLLAVTATNLRSIPHRLGNSLVIVIGIAGVVGVFIPVLAMTLSFRATIQGDARADRAIVLARSATEEGDSSLSRDEVAQIMNYPGVRRDAQRRPLTSGEVIFTAPVTRKGDHVDVNVTLRGVSEQYFAMRPELRLLSGRLFQPGKQELIVGAAAHAQFAGLEIGNRVALQDGDWTVVGIFAGGNGARESELVSDAQTVMSAYKRNTFNSIAVALDSADSFAVFNDTVVRNSKSLLGARSEPEYLATASEWVNRMLRLVAYSIGSIMALGALFSALNSMYSAVAARAAEMATLRAIGFPAAAVAFAVLSEALLLGLVGAAIGAAVAYVLFDGATLSMLGGAGTQAQLVYSLTVTPGLVVTVILAACTVALAGALAPAIRAARSNIADTLHET